MPSIINATTTAGVAVTGDNSGALALQTNNGTTAVTIDTSQNVCIGTSSPATQLQMNSGAATYSDQLRVRNTNFGNADIGVGSGIMALATDMSNIVFYTSSSLGTTGSALPTNERMRIDSSGTVLVNTTGLTYGARLQVFEGGSNRAASFQTTANDQALLTRCSIAGFSNTVQFVTVDRTANSGFNFMQLVSSGTGDNEFVFRGDGNGYADGTWNNNGADYAEFFESSTGQSIPVGSTVVLDDNKVRLATESDNADDVIGVVRPKEPSKASMVVGNTAWNKWANKYLTDDFDRYIMEDHNTIEWTDADGKQHSYESHNIPQNVVVPNDATVKTHDENGKKFQHYKLNPAWNPDAEYVNRENRDEWLIIGLVGQVKVLKGQKMGSRWVKMRDVSANVEEWFIR